MMNYRVLQLTNHNLPAVAANTYLPLGGITRSIRPKQGCCPSMVVSTSLADTVTVNETGNYNISYSASLIAGAAGDIAVSLEINGMVLYTATATAAAVGSTVNLSFVYQTKVCKCCAPHPTSCPANVRILLGTEAVTGGSSNLLIERVYT